MEFQVIATELQAGVTAEMVGAVVGGLAPVGVALTSGEELVLSVVPAVLEIAETA